MVPLFFSLLTSLYHYEGPTKVCKWSSRRRNSYGKDRPTRWGPYGFIEILRQQLLFQLGDWFLIQDDGLLMGSRMSATIANIYMETFAINTQLRKPAPSKGVNTKLFMNICLVPSIKFTVKTEERCMIFLRWWNWERKCFKTSLYGKLTHIVLYRNLKLLFKEETNLKNLIDIDKTMCSTEYVAY